MPKVYLAGPIVFREDAQQVFSRMKLICSYYGLEGIAPIDNQQQLDKFYAGRSLTLKIAEADFQLMDQADAGIFCLDSFRRSTEMDPGTAVEVGYLMAQHKPMAAWTTDSREYPQKVKDFFLSTGEQLRAIENEKLPSSGQLRDPDGILVHSQGMYQNAMAQGAVELSGGKVFSASNWEYAFHQAAQSLAAQLKSKHAAKFACEFFTHKKRNKHAKPEHVQGAEIFQMSKLFERL